MFQKSILTSTSSSTSAQQFIHFNIAEPTPKKQSEESKAAFHHKKDQIHEQSVEAAVTKSIQFSGIYCSMLGFV